MICMVSGVRFREADTCTLYPLVFNCRGGSWYVMCAKSVAVTSLCAHSHCLDKNFVFLCFLMKEESIAICCSSLSTIKCFVCLF